MRQQSARGRNRRVTNRGATGVCPHATPCMLPHAGGWKRRESAAGGRMRQEAMNEVEGVGNIEGPNDHE